MKVTGGWKGEAFSLSELIWTSRKLRRRQEKSGARWMLRRAPPSGSRGDQVGVAVENLSVMLRVPLGIRGELPGKVLGVAGVTRLQFLRHQGRGLGIDRPVAEAPEERDLTLGVLGKGNEVPDLGAGGIALRHDPRAGKENALVEVEVHAAAGLVPQEERAGMPEVAEHH